jgi:hypothetical protein
VIVEFHPQQFVLVAGDCLAIQIIQAVKALADAPVDVEDAEFGFLDGMIQMDEGTGLHA